MEKIFNFKNTYVDLPKVFYRATKPAKVKKPKIVIFNSELAKKLGLRSDISFETLEKFLSGNEIQEGSTPIAQAYAGHQFGHFTMLGDGRAILLGEILRDDGKIFDIQLKGAGITAYSRGGDGRASLGPMLREYIISEAMAFLGVKTTRSLAVVETGEPVYREKELRGAVLTRVADSHIRIGTFQYARGLESYEDLKALADYSIKRHYNECLNEENPYLHFLRAVIENQAKLVSSWNLLGFIHGVMNTDNITISGETIDYGPCAFMNEYNPDTVFSSIDTYGRYSFKNQPNILGWNLARFAETLIPLLHEDYRVALDLAKGEIMKYPKVYTEFWVDGMRKKLGLFDKEEDDKKLIDMLLSIMNNSKADYTNTFRDLTKGDFSGLDIFKGEDFKLWKNLWEERLSRENKSLDEVKALMKSVNPYVIPRNHKVEEALTFATEYDDLEPFLKLLEVLENPYNYDVDIDSDYLVGKSDKCYKTYCGT